MVHVGVRQEAVGSPAGVRDALQGALGHAGSGVGAGSTSLTPGLAGSMTRGASWRPTNGSGGSARLSRYGAAVPIIVFNAMGRPGGEAGVR